MPLGRFDPCPDCCLEICGNCAATPPSELEARFTGLVSHSPPGGDCDCEGICGVDHVCTLVGPCIWRYNFDPTGDCGLDHIEISLTAAGTIRVRLSWSELGENYVFYEKTGLADPLDCDNIDEVLPYDSSLWAVAKCTLDSVFNSTCRVTS